jgi:dihydroorotase
MSAKPLLIKGGRFIDPRNKRDEVADVLLRDGLVAQIGKGIKAAGAEIFEATGKVVTPGLIDVHVHLREPGQEDKETIASGTAAAAMGGFTAVACMPNTVPALDNVSRIQFVLMKARSEGRVRVYPVGAITKNQEGQELTEIGAMLRAGCVALSDDGKPVANSNMFRRALEYAKTFDAIVMDHCEDPELFNGGAMNEGELSARLGLKGIPRQAEYISVSRNIALCELTGARIHLTHMSTRESVALIREAKKRKLPITADTCPHYFTLTEAAVDGYNTLAKMNPPLRQEADRQAIIAGLLDGTLDTICSDHAPHTAAQKAQEFSAAPFGIVGLETTVGLVITEMVGKHKMSLTAAIAALTDAPARALNLPGGHLSLGSTADVTVLDPKATWTVEKFASKSRNSPFIGRTLTGQAVATIVDGAIVMANGRLS